MDPTFVGLVVFACAFAGVLFGMWLRAKLPEHLLSAESRDTIKVGIGLIATITALVLGLITASAKSAFDVVDTAVKQSAAEILALDRALARYGPETKGIREGLRRAVGTRIETVWPQGSTRPVDLDPMRGGTMLRSEALADAIRDLKPQDDAQRGLQARALDLAEMLLQERWIVITDTGVSIPMVFLAVLLFWLTFTFASFGLLAPQNAMVIAVLFVCALSVGSAVFLVLEMDRPFEGLIKVSGAPLRYAYAHLSQ